MTEKKKLKKNRKKKSKGLSRRKFLGASATAAAAAGVHSFAPVTTTTTSGPVISTSACAISVTPITDPPKLIVLFGRGGWDGMSMCVPYGITNYAINRPLPDVTLMSDAHTLGFSAPGTGTIFDCIKLTNTFGLSDGMSGLLSAWNKCDLTFVNQVGYTSNHSFSHFTSQNQIEVGQPAPPANFTSGWLARHLETSTNIPDPILRGLSFGVSKPRSMVPVPSPTVIAPCVATPDPDNYGLKGDTSTATNRLSTLQTMYVNEGTFGVDAQNAVAAVNHLAQVNFAGYTPSGGAVYPSGSLGKTFQDIAAIIDNPNVDPEIYTVDFGSWDHHNNSDPHNRFNSGFTWSKMDEMSRTLGAFYKDLKAKGHRNWVVIGMTEFGRRVSENGSKGTDHGAGNCMFLLGEPVNKGIKGSFDPLPTVYNPANTLPITTDFRDVLAEVIDEHLGNPSNLGYIFPSYSIGPYLNVV